MRSGVIYIIPNDFTAEFQREWIDRYVTALHEIEQAARAEGERAGTERMREAAAKVGDGIVDCLRCVSNHCINTGDIEGRVRASAKMRQTEEFVSAIRALPAPAEPAKGA